MEYLQNLDLGTKKMTEEGEDKPHKPRRTEEEDACGIFSRDDECLFSFFLFFGGVLE